MSTGTPIGTISGTSEKVSGAASQVHTRASGLGQMVEEKIDHGRRAAADGLDSAATALHEKADNLPGGEKVASAAHTAAKGLGSTADYIRTSNLKGMMEDLQQVVKNNPGASLLTAAALGFLVARAFSRN